ncbi:MAG TPA: hypothetical protein VGG64_09400 [Pirellulales bacterium]
MSVLLPSPPYIRNSIAVSVRHDNYSERFVDHLETELYPGHLVEYTATGTVQRRSTIGGDIPFAVAMESPLNATSNNGQTTIPSTIYTVFNAAVDRANILYPGEGDTVLLRLQAGQSVVKDQPVICAGDGSVMAWIPSGKVYASTADSDPITNTADGTPFPGYTFPANTLLVGDVVRVRGYVVCPLTNGSDTLTLALSFGSSAVFIAGPLDVANNNLLYFDALVAVEAVGPSGSIVGSGTTAFGATGTTPKAFELASSPIDTTMANEVYLLAQWSAASTGDSAVLRQFVVSLERVYDRSFAVADEDCDNSDGDTELFLLCRSK